MLRLRGGADEEKKPEEAAADEDDDRRVNLMSQEGDQFEVEVKVAKMRELVKTMIPEEADEDEEAQEIPLPNVKSHVLAKVIEFCRRYAEEPMSEIEKPLKSANMHEVVQEWYANYVDVDQELLFELILAANYMDIKPLLDLTCATVASMIKGKTPEEIPPRRPRPTSKKTYCSNSWRRPQALRRGGPGAPRRQDVQHRQRLHARGGGAGPRGERCARRPRGGGVRLRPSLCVETYKNFRVVVRVVCALHAPATRRWRRGRAAFGASRRWRKAPPRPPLRRAPTTRTAFKSSRPFRRRSRGRARGKGQPNGAN